MILINNCCLNTSDVYKAFVHMPHRDRPDKGQPNKYTPGKVLSDK